MDRSPMNSGSDSSNTPHTLDTAALAATIDHTLLKAEARQTDVEQLCDEALAHQFATVCVNSLWRHDRPSIRVRDASEHR